MVVLHTVNEIILGTDLRHHGSIDRYRCHERHHEHDGGGTPECPAHGILGVRVNGLRAAHFLTRRRAAIETAAVKRARDQRRNGRLVRRTCQTSAEETEYSTFPTVCHAKGTRHPRHRAIFSKTVQRFVLHRHFCQVIGSTSDFQRCC